MSNLDDLRELLYNVIESQEKNEILKVSREIDKIILEEMIIYNYHNCKHN